MKTHHIEWFEADDGKIFQDEMSCIDYEYQLLYTASGYRFYKDGQMLKTVPSNLSAVSSFDYYTLDESNPKANKAFKDYSYHMYGYDFDYRDWPPPETNSVEWFRKQCYYNKEG